MATPPPVTGLVFDIQRFSLFNGPGIRTTVFLKGCPLRCPWCHNPEGLTCRPQLRVCADRCLRCGACVAACEHQAQHLDAGGTRKVDRLACVACGTCADHCPAEALAIVGNRMSVEQVMAVVRRDRGYYLDTGGGMTLSGGEPLAQAAYALALLRAAKQEHLHTAVETSGCGAWNDLQALAPVTDLFLFDLKETDAQRHAAVVGAPLEPILDNLRRLGASGARIVLRLPMVPGFNDRPDHIAGVAKLARELPGLAGADLLPYHALGEGKRAALQDTVPPAVAHPPETVQVEAWRRAFAAAGLRVCLPEDGEAC